MLDEKMGEIRAIEGAVVRRVRSGEGPDYHRNSLSRSVSVPTSGFSELEQPYASGGGSAEIREARLTRIPCRCGELLGEVIEDDLVKVTHRVENEVSEVRAQIIPQCPLARQLLPHGLK